MDKLKALATFASVAARGSLSAAARAEGVAPAVIGRRMNALEEHLGVKLMVRTTRRLTLTNEGTAFLEDCQRILAEVAQAEASVSAGNLQVGGHLRIAAPAGFGRRHVAPLVPPFQAAHPQLRISLDLSDRLVDLAAESYDCAVRVGDLPDSSLISIRLADNQRLSVASPDYLRQHGIPQHPRELGQHRCLALTSEASQTRGWAFMEDGRVIYQRIAGPLDCNDGQVLHDWCLAGHGIAWRSGWEVEHAIAAGQLEVVLKDFMAPPNGIYAVLPHRTHHLPLRTRLWVDFLKARYARPDYWNIR